MIVTQRTLRGGVAKRPIVLISARGSDGAPHCWEGSSRGSPQITGKGHRKHSPRATMRLTREANPKRTLHAEVAQRLNVLISAQRVAPPHILSKSPAEACSKFTSRVAASSHQAMGLSKS